MDEQTLERLMIDDALGSLSPDMTALLAAFVQIHGEGETQLSQWQTLGVTVRETLRGEAISAPSLRPLHVARFRYLARMTTSVAAILAVGFALGIAMRNKPAPPAAPVAIVASIPQEPQSAPAAGGFWSSRRLMAMALQSEQHAVAPRQWTWPLNKQNTAETR